MKFISQYKLILLVAIFFATFYNLSFFTNVISIYEPVGKNILYICSLAIVLVAFTVFLFTLLSSKYTTKPLLIITLMVSSFTAYFMDTYRVVIDDEMIRNSLQTNLAESSDLFSFQLVFYVLLLGILPSYFVYKIKLEYRPLKKELLLKVGTIIVALIFVILPIFSFSKFYTSFFREHKPLRYHVNPIYWIYSTGNYISKTMNSGPMVVKPIGLDAKIQKTEDEIDKKELIIMVVGEATRADRFSLNGYEKETNPLLKKEDVVNFSNFYSCGTSTAQSVPCMFSIYDRDTYDYKKGITTQNVLDVLINTKDVKVLWRDNNSSSKGVADRVDYEDYRTNKNNTICDDECRDEGMLIGLDNYIKKNKDKDILIVLHQMGNHGPAYYKRYPKDYEKFTPVCETNQLEQCTQEEVSNAYDNAVLYSDYFLSKTINFLKPYSKDYETAMVYMSDHGESLGENGLYLHGMPYFMAPDEQKHVASFMWFGEGDIKEDIDVDKLKSYSDKKFSQDNLFHTLLSFFEVETDVYEKEMDILNDAKKSH
ncbi:phosphoethanolamine transferase [Poseidonibacter parvus]|uniref:Phosphoethanolamine transferase n=1 Tax=Poseidonibacter parvus TaxID=1850254 RepID=A0A1P8KMH0_9BACT|nr:phosphoethanolamine--lipid A transferase [Poseidonibacter parvus]APW65753.1 phosphoethanolamine transferase [Poseidonibacter parvus]